VDGFLVDRGFQVLLTAYPELDRQLDRAALRLRAFEPGALVRIGDRFHAVGDPFRRPGRLLSTAMAPVGTPLDKLRLLSLRRRLRAATVPQLLRGQDVDTAVALRDERFGSTMVDRFFRPLVGGIQLDPDLTASRRMFDTIFRTLSEGDAAVPAAGMGAIPRQMAARLDPRTIHLNRPASRVEPGRVTLEGDEVISADRIVVATEGPAASQLLGLRPVGSRPATCVWFAVDRPPTDSRLIVLDGNGTGPALNVAVMSNVAPEYAPEGSALVAAACPGVADAGIEPAVRRQLRGWWGTPVDGWRHLRTHVIAHGQPDQRPPFSPKQRVSLGDGLFVCGDHRDTASIQGAMYSGRRCGTAVVSSLS
jgi:phytoene dehydrogenase-like protein